MPEQFIHIGLPRTASTFFQQKVFNRIPGLNYHGPEITQYHPAFNQLLYADESQYSEKTENKIRQLITKDNFILSNENFCGQSLYFNYSNRSRTAKRLSRLFPEATVILFLRNQTDLLRSLYAINLQWKETKSIEEFINTHDAKQSRAESAGPLSAYYNTYDSSEPLAGYDFNALSKLYKKLFPNVELLLYEELKTNPEKTTERLESIFKSSLPEEVQSAFSEQQKINKGVSNAAAIKLRKLNRYHEIVSGNSFLLAIYQKRKRQIMTSDRHTENIHIPEYLHEKIKTYYTSSNRKLSASNPELNLERYAREYFLND